MKKLLFIIITISLFGCEEKRQAPMTATAPGWQLSKKIMLKDITTGIKPNKSVEDGYLGKWSYFGKDRVVITEKTEDGTISSIKILMDGAESLDLQPELEKKFSEIEGRQVFFNCESKTSVISQLNNLKTNQEDCVMKHENQTLTISSIMPGDVTAISRHPNLHQLFFSTTVILNDAKLTEKKAIELKQKQADESAKQLDAAKKDL